MARPVSDRTPAPLLLGGPAGAPPGGGALLGLRSLLQGTGKPKEPASCEFQPPPVPTRTPNSLRDSGAGRGRGATSYVRRVHSQPASTQFLGCLGP